MEEKRLYYKVPHRAVKLSEKGGSNLHVIGLIDASGSMSSWWKWIAEFWNSDAIPKENLRTITFDTRPRQVPTNVLSTRIQDHGGGGTAIPEAIAELEKVIETIPVGESITAIFISDGQDSYANTLETRMKKLKGNHTSRPINFICLGIQSGFPTFISMRLRELFHNGDDNVPALYLIEYVSEKAFFNKFEGMRQYFYSAGSVKLDPAVMVYPWDESVVDQAYEGSWVIVKGDTIAIDDGEPIQIQKLELTVEDAVEIFRGWVQKLQMISLTSPSDARASAQIAVNEMRYAISELNKRYDIDVRTVTEEQAAATKLFGLRAKLNYIWRYGSKIDWFFTEVDNLAQGVVPKNTSEFDAAKRMNIGTITGKHQQKALALRNVTPAEFQVVKAEFANVLLANKAKAAEVLAESAKRENGFITSNVELFANVADFITGLEYCKNQYDFFETLPFAGVPSKAKRNEGYMENVRLIEYKNVYFAADHLNIATLSSSTNQWNVPTQIADEKVEINAILPILRVVHADFLRPLLKTRLMKMIFSFFLTTNYDAIYEDALLNILSSTLLLAYQQQSHAIKDQLTGLIYEALVVAYENDKAFQIVQDNLSADPSAVVLEFQERDDLLFLHLFYAQRSKRLDEDSLAEAGRKARMLYFQKLVKKVGLYSLVKPDFESIGVEAVVEAMKPTIDTFFSLSEFRKGFLEQFAKYAKEAASKKLEVTKKYLSETEIAKVNVTLLEALLHPVPVASLSAEEQDAIQSEYIVQIAHVAKAGTLAEAFSSPVEKDLSSIKEQVVLSLDESAIKKVKVFNEVFGKLETMYTELYVKRHWNVQPIPKDELIKHCEAKGVVFDTLQLDEASLLCKNACLSPACPFFLQTNAKFNRHLGGWQGKMPLGFHRFVKARANQPAAKLYTLALTKWKGFPASYNVTEEFAKDYIQKTLNSYLADAPIVHDTATG